MSEDQENAVVDDPRPVLAQACRALRVFPLPGAVVLPGTPAPLHVFEPRYREMVADALASDGVIAVAMLVSDEDAEDDRAAIHPIACAGIVEEHELLPDGHYNLLLRGLGRVRLVKEIDNGKPYRQFEAELLEDVYPPECEYVLVRERRALEACVRQLSEVLPVESGAPQLAQAVLRTESLSEVADLVAAAVVSEPKQRLAVLEELDVGRRLDLVTGEVASVVLLLSRGRTPSA